MAEIKVKWITNDWGTNTYRIFDIIGNIERPPITLEAGIPSVEWYPLTADSSDEGAVDILKEGGAKIRHSMLKNEETVKIL